MPIPEFSDLPVLEMGKKEFDLDDKQVNKKKSKYRDKRAIKVAISLVF